MVGQQRAPPFRGRRLGLCGGWGRWGPFEGGGGIEEGDDEGVVELYWLDNWLRDMVGDRADVHRLAEVSSCFADSSNSVREVFPDTKLLSASKYRGALGPRFFVSCPLSVDVEDSDIVVVEVVEVSPIVPGSTMRAKVSRGSN